MAETELTENELEELQEKLQEIKDQEGVIGYIVRGTKSASINLKDPTKIIDYAVLSSTAFDVTTELTEALEMAQPQQIIIESNETKLLSINLKDHRLSIFMDKNVNHNDICNNLK